MHISSIQVWYGYVFFSTLENRGQFYTQKRSAHVLREYVCLFWHLHRSMLSTPPQDTGYFHLPAECSGLSQSALSVLISFLGHLFHSSGTSDIIVLSFASSSWWSCFKAFIWLGLSSDSLAWLLCQGGKISMLGIRWGGPLESAALERMEKE